MFGYVKILEPELKVKDFRRYKSYYCGLCRELKERYGSLGQMTLTYDMTFAIILLTSLYEPEIRQEKFRCKVHPFRRQTILRSEFTSYAADMNILLAYYHFHDDWSDERKISGFAGSRLFHRTAVKIEEKYPRQAQIIKKELNELSRLEKIRTDDLDLPAGCFGRLMSELFVCREDVWRQNLKRMGFYLGKFIYLMDAYDDLERDIEKGSYNPLISLSHHPDFENECKEILCMMIAECSSEFEKLPCLLDVDILRNILYDGVWNTYRIKQQKKREDQSNESESL